MGKLKLFFYFSQFFIQERDLQNFFKVNFRHCESRSASCTLENRMKAAVVKYMLESCQGLNQVFYRNVCPESP